MTTFHAPVSLTGIRRIFRAKRNAIVAAIAGLTIAAGLAAPALAAEHKVISMYLNAGNANDLQIPAGGYTVDQTTVLCPNVTCTFGLTAMQQIVSVNSPSWWRIVVFVDGKNVDSGPWQGPEPISNTYALGNWQGKYTVAKGSHSVTFQCYLQVTALLSQWSDTVTITAP